MQLRRSTLVLSLAFLLGDWLLVLLAAVHIGFVSDDFYQLFGDRGRPWYYSSDPLYRPLRNGLLKLWPVLFGLYPEPYRILAFFVYLDYAVLLYRLLRRAALGQIASLGATILVFFNPRMGALLYGSRRFKTPCTCCASSVCFGSG